ncbi:hypothetical protein CRG98_047490 [Punica granatum]|uniref:Uncharacterized protein n=1 Tax=Punica granatum TaxID=22663 RepID=A0A2I0HKD0_PUNGR|nr:hypothetical protein CRG98_047490 [Punica granatum]
MHPISFIVATFYGLSDFNIAVIAFSSHQVRKIAATAADIDNRVNHVHPQGIKVTGQMHGRKLMVAVNAMLDYEKPKPNPRHDDKGKSGGG